MKKDYTKYLAAAVGVIATTAIVAGATYAYQGDDKSNDKFRGKNFNTEQHEAIIEAIDNKDYVTWKELMGDNPITEKINEDNFDKFVEARRLMLEGQYEEAKALREELGLQQGGRGFKNGMDGMRRGKKFDTQDFIAIKDAIINNDYTTWKNLMADKPMAEKITEEDFAKMVEMHNLMQAGNLEEAKVLREELGLNMGGFGEMGRGMGRLERVEK